MTSKQEYLEALIERLFVEGRLTDAGIGKAVSKGMLSSGKAADVKKKPKKPKP